MFVLSLCFISLAVNFLKIAEYNLLDPSKNQRVNIDEIHSYARFHRINDNP